MRCRIVVAPVIVLALACASCATMAPPKPWEKGDLARPAMQFGSDPLGDKSTSHVYESKEMAGGGGSVGGGGCGCN